MSLTDKQKTFVTEYLVDLNATQAAIRAGYSAKNADKIGSQLLGKSGVAAAVQAAMDKRSEKTEITAEYVLTGIRDVTERCAKVGDDHNPAAALKGYELLGKHLKLFTEKHEHSNPDGSLRPSVIRIVAADDRSGTATPS